MLRHKPHTYRALVAELWYIGLCISGHCCGENVGKIGQTLLSISSARLQEFTWNPGVAHDEPSWASLCMTYIADMSCAVLPHADIKNKNKQHTNWHDRTGKWVSCISPWHETLATTSHRHHTVAHDEQTCMCSCFVEATSASSIKYAGVIMHGSCRAPVRETCKDDADGTHLINRLAQGLQVNLVVHVVLLQLKQSCLMLIVHHPPATQHSQSQDMTYCAKCVAPRPVQILLEIHRLLNAC